MRLFFIAGYFVAAIVIYSVLTNLARGSGRLSGNIERGIVALALIWPIWGDLAVLGLANYGLCKVVQASVASEGQQEQQ